MKHDINLIRLLNDMFKPKMILEGSAINASSRIILDRPAYVLVSVSAEVQG